MAVRTKKIRAKRARARQRERRGHDLRPHYREADLPATAHIGVVTVEDPYQPAVDKAGNLVVEAQLEPVRHSDGSLSEGAPAWTPPQRPLLTAVTNLRQDPLGRMHARHQVDEAQYGAARAYQRLHETATIGNLSPAAMRLRVDGGQIPDPVSDARMVATKRLHSVEETLQEYYGLTGLALTRSVLTNGKTLEKTAREFGADSARGILFWGQLFRRCLDVLARALGLANTMARPRRVHPFNDAPNPADPELHAGADELVDPGLRRGRPNGSG